MRGSDGSKGTTPRGGAQTQPLSLVHVSTNRRAHRRSARAGSTPIRSARRRWPGSPTGHPQALQDLLQQRIDLDPPRLQHAHPRAQRGLAGLQPPDLQRKRREALSNSAALAEALGILAFVLGILIYSA